jgi:hypothetical protein
MTNRQRLPRNDACLDAVALQTFANPGIGKLFLPNSIAKYGNDVFRRNMCILHVKRQISAQDHNQGIQRLLRSQDSVIFKRRFERGRISVRSRLGKGTSFDVFLPLTQRSKAKVVRKKLPS